MRVFAPKHQGFKVYTDTIRNKNGYELSLIHPNDNSKDDQSSFCKTEITKLYLHDAHLDDTSVQDEELLQFSKNKVQEFNVKAKNYFRFEDQEFGFEKVKRAE
eukprot:CAMPEP_0170568024 /NCGR_PEP_ID=MMETSP0211-20121228/80867_1 /TAXON_ID=311385 /ORGANISM="Pseudokeronopsis sp., Strain OXSARD2" /LENGTH=102 /DNA_ID=CAMNT_0010889669 /DNA_START=1149 /DNA_END=1457 /DNA_ORIENTATION=-